MDNYFHFQNQYSKHLLVYSYIHYRKTDCLRRYILSHTVQERSDPLSMVFISSLTEKSQSEASAQALLQSCFPFVFHAYWWGTGVRFWQAEVPPADRVPALQVSRISEYRYVHIFSCKWRHNPSLRLPLEVHASNQPPVIESQFLQVPRDYHQEHISQFHSLHSSFLERY